MRYIKNNDKSKIFTLKMLKLNLEMAETVSRMIIGSCVIISDYALKRIE